MATMRPAERLSTIIGITADSPLREPRRAMARSAASRPIRVPFGSPVKRRETAPEYSSGRRPSSSLTLTSADTEKTVLRLPPEKPLEFTRNRSASVSSTPAVTERMASLPMTLRAPVSASAASWRRRSMVSSS
jgi:hypothetical protein